MMDLIVSENAVIEATKVDNIEYYKQICMHGNVHSFGEYNHIIYKNCKSKQWYLVLEMIKNPKCNPTCVLEFALEASLHFDIQLVLDHPMVNLKDISLAKRRKVIEMIYIRRPYLFEKYREILKINVARDIKYYTFYNQEMLKTMKQNYII